MLNAFRHQRKKRRRGINGTASPVACSTPSGIKGRNAGNVGREAMADLRCSTPSGIKGRNARARSIHSSDEDRAQRLPESKEETRDRPRLQHAGDDVLNAFRHQRKKRCSVWIWAGVRSACSTPSGIKGRNASTATSRPTWAARVLNAFRHQRKKRGGNVNRPRRQGLVLNAFRHQRKKRAKRRGKDPQGFLCSTPSGIKGRNAGLGAEGVGAEFAVLNAFRHQRKKRSLEPVNPLRQKCAQRLPASKEETPRSSRARTGRSSSCSTPSGIKGRNAARSPPRLAP